MCKIEMMSQKLLKSLLDPSQGVQYDEDIDAMSLARSLVSGSLKKNYKCNHSVGFEINLNDEYTIADILCKSPGYFVEEYYTVPCRSTMWFSLEEAGAEKARKEVIAEVPGDTSQEKLDLLLKCDCCERHKRDKPGSLNDTHLCSMGLSCSTVVPDCKCSCRNVARWIVREHQKIK